MSNLACMNRSAKSYVYLHKNASDMVWCTVYIVKRSASTNSFAGMNSFARQPEAACHCFGLQFHGGVLINRGGDMVVCCIHREKLVIVTVMYVMLYTS
jgi:hypothetical protein